MGAAENNTGANRIYREDLGGFRRGDPSIAEAIARSSGRSLRRRLGSVLTRHVDDGRPGRRR
jgi:hypothetical protein